MTQSQFKQILIAAKRYLPPPEMGKICGHSPKELCRCSSKPPEVYDYPGQKRANLRRYTVYGRTLADDSPPMSYLGATQWRWRRIYAELQKAMTADELAEAYALGWMDLPASENVRITKTHKNLRFAHQRATRKSSDAAKREARRRAKNTTPPATPQDAQDIADRHGMTLDAALYVITGF